MERILVVLGMSIGSWLGWKLGAIVSFFTGFIVSMIGLGLGMYAARRIMDELP